MKKNIIIANRLLPFSHRPGVRALVPGTVWEVEAFPTLLRFHDRTTHLEEGTIVFPIELKGPIDDFTFQLDLERGVIIVFGRAEGKFFRYFLKAKEEGIFFSWDKPHGRKDNLILKTEVYKTTSVERGSFGEHKLQDWDNVVRRKNLKEIFPFWLRIAQLTPVTSDFCPEDAGTAELLPKGNFLHLFQAGFRGILSPRLEDEDHLGLVDHPRASAKSSPLALLSKSAKLIRSQFIQEKDEELFLLPHLPKGFVSGRWINDQISFEWTKGRMRRAILHPGKARKLMLYLPKEIKTFRVRHSFQEKGETAARDTPLFLHEGKALLLDRFRQ